MVGREIGVAVAVAHPACSLSKTTDAIPRASLFFRRREPRYEFKPEFIRIAEADSEA
jgi:hypothetical protein